MPEPLAAANRRVPVAVDSQLSDQSGLGRRLRHLIWGRLAIAVWLLGSTIIFQPGEGDETVFGRSSMLSMLVVISSHLLAGIGFAIFFSFRKIKRLAGFTLVQIVWDLVFVTALVALTGGINSIFSFLYWLTILNAAFLLFRGGAFAAAALSGLFYAALVNLQYFSWIPDFLNVLGDPPIWQESQVISSIVLNSAGFFLVAFFSSLIAGMYRETETKLAQKSLEVEDLEALMVRIVESLTHGLVTLDAQGRVSYWNGMAEEITGLLSEEVRGSRFVELFPGAKEYFEADSVHGNKERRPWRWEMPYSGKDGNKRILGCSRSGLRHGEEEGRGTLIMFEDLTQYRNLEERVRRADRLAVIGELAARMAHEIRNPLTSVSGAIEVLRAQHTTAPEDEKLMNIVVRETDRLNQLLSDFLTYARPTPPQFEEVDVDGMIRETVELFSSSLVNRTVRVSLDLESDLVLWGDPKRLCQMIWNLLKNASESMEKSGGAIRVVLRGDSEKGEVSIEVKDDGPGISREVQDQIFQPFFTTKNRGNGLGLAVVHQIAEEHGGSILVENQEIGGAAFRVLFPRRRMTDTYGGA